MMLNEADMDFRIPGLPHSVVKQLQSANVRQPIQKIENHPDRHALQKDLQQNQSFYPFSPESKQMIRDVGNIELCELLETEPKTQCKVCLSYWNIGILYCTCGHFLRKWKRGESAFHQLYDGPSFSSWNRYGKKPGDEEYHDADQLKKKCKKKYFQGIHDRLVRDTEFRRRMIENNRDEELCRKWDALADEDHTHHLTSEDYYYLYKSNWWLQSNKQGSNTVRTTHRSDFKKALSTLQQLKQKEEGALHTPTNWQKSTMGTKFFFMVELARFMVDSVFLRKSRWRWNQVLTERSDLL